MTFMKKIIVFEMTSLDGYFEGRNGSLNWHRVDEEVNNFFCEQLDDADTILFGRKTFEMMQAYWPTENAIAKDPVVSEKMNSYRKYFFSRSKRKFNWQNTALINKDIQNQIKQISDRNGKNILVFGSADLCRTLIKMDIIDEVRIMVNPVILGVGITFFRNCNARSLSLIKVRVFGNGNVLLQYTFPK